MGASAFTWNLRDEGVQPGWGNELEAGPRLQSETLSKPNETVGQTDKHQYSSWT